jgi:hypothetical protein
LQDNKLPIPLEGIHYYRYISSFEIENAIKTPEAKITVCRSKVVCRKNAFFIGHPGYILIFF